MSDSLIHDAAFSGSPLMSYGEAPSKQRILKLLAFIAGSFVLVLIGLGIWFWGFTSMEIPSDPMVLAIVPSGFTLPAEAPEIWRKTAEINDPLPTVLGFMTNGKDSKVIPFAVQVFSLGDLFQEQPLTVWRLVTSSGDKGATKTLSPMGLLGNPIQMARKLVWLHLDPTAIIGSNQTNFSLPTRFEGYFDGKVWEIGAPPIDQTGGDASLTSNFVILSGQASDYMANYSLTNGVVWQSPRAGWLAWKQQVNSLDITLYPSTSSVSSSTADFVPSKLMLAEHSLLLADGTDYSELNPPQPTTSTQDLASPETLKFRLPQSPSNIESRASVDAMACPGKTVAIFDSKSLKNICSWIDICIVEPSQLVISQLGERTFFCIK